jgi:hypothetical protein
MAPNKQRAEIKAEDVKHAPDEPLRIEIVQDYIEIDGTRFSRAFFETLAEPDPSRLYRLFKRPQAGAVIFEIVDPK